MNKRLKIVIISFISAALMLCGWTAYASTSSSTATSTTINGKLTALTADTITLHTNAGDQTVPLASSVWVYLNDQKAQLSDLHTGNEIELILNNKKQAAYVKGTSETAVASEPKPSQTPVPSEPPVKEAPSSPAGPTSSPTKMKESAPEAPPTSSRSDLEDMDVSVDGQHFNLHIKQSKGSQGPQFDLKIQSPHAGTIHLTGTQAQAWISKLLGSIDLNASGAQQVLGQQLAKQYDLDASKLNVHLKMSSEEKEDEHEDEHENEKKQVMEKDKDKDKNKDKEKNEKKHGNSNKHD